MKKFEIVAHRGVASEAPENTIASFERAIDLGADAVEFDVRLTADRIPVVYHYYYLDLFTTGNGPIFGRTLDQLRDVRVHCPENPRAPEGKISTLEEVMERIGGRIGMEIEIKGPEPEAPALIGAILEKFKSHWPSIELISFEPALLIAMHGACPGIPVDLLIAPAESWMQPDAVAYQAAHHARLANARAVHLHSSQLLPEVTGAIRSQGVDIHAWNVNDLESMNRAARLEIPRICTDRVRQALEFRGNLK